MGDDRVHDHVDDFDTDLRKAQRHFWSSLVVHHRHRDFSCRFSSCRRGDGHVSVGHLPGRSRSRRGWLDGTPARHHGRHARPARTSQISGLLPRRFWCLQHHWAAHRRPAVGHAGNSLAERVALGLPDQRAHRNHRPRRRASIPAPSSPPTQGAHRLVGRGNGHHRNGAIARRRRAGSRMGLGLSCGNFLLRLGRRWRRRLRSRRTPNG
ncbi:unannotated protein [freshwater metagenome]|uniref:Unannotated protein n=1 Tax=freshwater metagenome TaxID=449393 RepID=A0A6J6E7M2_9ZZZZ